MRHALSLMLGCVVLAGLIAGVWFWASSPMAIASAPQTIAAREPERLPSSAQPAMRESDPETTAGLWFKNAEQVPAPPPAQVAKPGCANPNAMGVSRVVEIDTTGGPGFGFEHFKQLDFLTDKEVVLTFDDGPWPGNTPAVLKTLADECTKAVFFPIGKHATYHPEILRQVAAAGHAVGAHTWSHANLNGKKLDEQQIKDELEKGFSAVKLGAW